MADKTKRYPDGSIYIGELTQNGTNMPHGYGEFILDGGQTMYLGEWKAGKMSGKGKFYWRDGSSFEGSFKNNKLHGFGVMKHEDSEREGRACIYQNSRRLCWQNELLHSQIRVKRDGVWVEGVVTKLSSTGNPAEVYIKLEGTRPMPFNLDTTPFELIRERGKIFLIEEASLSPSQG